MTAYDVEAWHDFFVMIGGAGAALAGLLFVAISFNHEQILKSAALTSLASRSLITLLSVVVVSAVGLTPQPTLALGIEALVLGILMVVVVTVTTFRTYDAGDLAAWKASRLGMAWVSSVPMVVGGISLVAHAGGGVYWLLGECVAAIVVGAYTAWILLIEIRR